MVHRYTVTLHAPRPTLTNVDSLPGYGLRTTPANMNFLRLYVIDRAAVDAHDIRSLVSFAHLIFP
jgi:hypothetical protein